MSKVGIINCYNESKICSSFGCFNAFNKKEGSFKNYNKDYEIICFTHCNGCSDDSIDKVLYKASRMKNRGVDTIHLGTCIKLKCKFYNEFMKELSKEFNVIGYTHD